MVAVTTPLALHSASSICFYLCPGEGMASWHCLGN